MEDIKPIIEALLFIAENPLTIDRIKTVLENSETKEIRAALHSLQQDYDERESGLTLREVAGGFQLRTRDRYNQWLKKMVQPSPSRLSKAALETLAIIAYKQPIIRADIEHIRGVDAGGVLRMLMEKKFIRVLGRKEIPGRPLIYATTKEFLEVFDLKDLNDLPSPKEIEELSQQNHPVLPETATESAPPDTTTQSGTETHEDHPAPNRATGLPETKTAAPEASHTQAADTGNHIEHASPATDQAEPQQPEHEPLLLPAPNPQPEPEHIPAPTPPSTIEPAPAMPAASEPTDTGAPLTADPNHKDETAP